MRYGWTQSRRREIPKHEARVVACILFAAAVGLLVMLLVTNAGIHAQRHDDSPVRAVVSDRV
jgi:hypothetical protein